MLRLAIKMDNFPDLEDTVWDVEVGAKRRAYTHSPRAAPQQRGKKEGVGGSGRGGMGDLDFSLIK